MTVRGIAAWLVLPLAACASETMVAGDNKAVTELAIAPYEIHEECMMLQPGARIDYRFEAKMPVYFDIRYREGSAIISTVSREEANAAAGVFAVPVARRYCVHWEAGREGALVDYRVRLLPAVGAR
jgi:hypothetical protein